MPEEIYAAPDYDPAVDQAEIDRIDPLNQERFTALMGKGIPFAPGTFENVRITCYLEHLLTQFGVLTKAKLDFANRVSAMLDQFENQFEEIEAKQRQMALAQGATLTPEQLAGLNVLGMNGPNRATRRHPV